MTKVVAYGDLAINDGINYRAALRYSHSLPTAEPVPVARLNADPLIGAVAWLPHQIGELGIFIEDEANEATLRRDLQAAFDPRQAVAQPLVIADDDGGRERFVMAHCRAFQQRPDLGGLAYVATLMVDGDTKFRSTAVQTDVWEISAISNTTVVANSGDADAYPRLVIEPTAAKGGDSYLYERWVPIRWRVDGVGFDYPIELTDGGWDTAALVTAGKMQASGNDLRVFVGGVELADRLVTGMNTANTLVWVALTFSSKQEAALAVAIGSSGEVESVDVSQAIEGFPSQGILMIDNEAFTYTGKNNQLRRFTGVTRARRGTAEAAHTVGTTVWWVEHDVSILYGNAAAGPAPTTQTLRSGMMGSASSNDLWVYQEVKGGDGVYDKVAAWNYVSISAFNEKYTAWQGQHHVDPTYDTIGIQVSDRGRAMWFVNNPCGFASVKFNSENERMAIIPAHWDGRIIVGSSLNSLIAGSWQWNALIAAPGSSGVWEQWSADHVILFQGTHLALWLRDTAGTGDGLFLDGFGDIELGIVASTRPLVSLGAEQEIYDLDAVIRNPAPGSDSGEAIRLTAQLPLNAELVVDTEARTVTLFEDDSNQFGALTLLGGARRDWLPLRPGNNELVFDDEDTEGVTVTIQHRRRYFD